MSPSIFTSHPTPTARRFPPLPPAKQIVLAPHDLDHLAPAALKTAIPYHSSLRPSTPSAVSGLGYSPLSNPQSPLPSLPNRKPASGLCSRSAPLISPKNARNSLSLHIVSLSPPQNQPEPRFPFMFPRNRKPISTYSFRTSHFASRIASPLTNTHPPTYILFPCFRALAPWWFCKLPSQNRPRTPKTAPLPLYSSRPFPSLFSQE